MKKTPLARLSGLALAVIALSVQRESQAAPPSTAPPSGPTALPGPRLDLPPSIAGFTFFKGGTSKVNPSLAGFALEVPVHVAGTNPRSGKLLVKRDGAAILDAPFTLGSGETKAIPVNDTVNAETTCRVTRFDLELEGSGFDVKKTATLKSSCSYTSESINPWNLAVPDRVEEREKNHVFFNSVNATFVAAGAGPTAHIPSNQVQACASNVVFTTTVKNDLNHAVSGLILRIRLANGIRKADSVPFALAAGASSSQTVHFMFAGEAGTYNLELVDPNNTAQGAIATPGFHVDVAHSCTVTTALDP